MKDSFFQQVREFVNRMEALRSSLPIQASLMTRALRDESDEFLKYIKEKCEVGEETDEKIEARIPEGEFTTFHRHRRRLARLSTAGRLIPRSFIVTLVSQYDVLVGELVRLMCRFEPRILSGSGKTLSYTELSGYRDMAEAKTAFIEMEVDSLNRDNHLEQLRYFEKKLSITLQSQPELIARFVEVTERRNLFVHCDGRVTRQYLLACEKAGYDFKEPVAEGQELFVAPTYFYHAVDTLLEVGIKLAHIVWNKMIPDEKCVIERSINEAAYELILQKRYHLAVTILDFGLQMPKRCSSTAIELMFTINKAQCFKWLGKQEECDSLLDQIDWSATSEYFGIGRAVLKDDFKLASEMMRKIAETGQIKKLDYQEWPLFTKFRETDDFRVAYKEIFSEDYQSIEKNTDKSLTAILSGDPPGRALP